MALIHHEAGMASTTDLPARRYGNQATQRVLNLLAMFIGSSGPRGVSELARETGMNKNMVHRLLTTLVDARYLVRDPGGERYQLGYRLLDLNVGYSIVDIRTIARPTLEKLHALTRESVFLSIIVGSSRVNVDWIEAQGRRVSFGQRGRSVPLHNSTMSRLLLAHLSDEEIAAYLVGAEPLDQFDALYPGMPPTTPAAIWEDVRKFRGVDHLTWSSPKQFDAAYIAFPIAGSNQRLHGAITVGGPFERFDPEQIAQQAGVLSAIAQLRQQCANLLPVPVMVASKGLA